MLDSGIVENNVSEDQLHDSQGDEVGGITENEVTDDVVTNVDPLLNKRKELETVLSLYHPSIIG